MTRAAITIAFFGVLFCLLSVVLGALAAHAVKSTFGPSSYDTFSLASQYQFYHGLGLLALAVFQNKYKNNYFTFAFISFSIGILLFSGSLYLLAVKSLLIPVVIKIIGPLTPIGGVFFIIGWIFFLIGIVKSRAHKSVV